jgi:hypothetical protein
MCRVESELIASKGNGTVVPSIVPIANVVETSVFGFATGDRRIAKYILERVEGGNTSFSGHYGWSG